MHDMQDVPNLLAVARAGAGVNTVSYTHLAAIKSRNYTFKVTSIANKAFKGDKKLKKVVIDKNVQVIGKRAFEKAKNLRRCV